MELEDGQDASSLQQQEGLGPTRRATCVSRPTLREESTNSTIRPHQGSRRLHHLLLNLPRWWLMDLVTIGR